MDIIPVKTCKTCKTEKPKIKFSGRSASCCACMYAHNKVFFVKYYEAKHEHLITYACHGVIPMCPPGGTYSIGWDSHFSATDLPVGPDWP